MNEETRVLNKVMRTDLTDEGNDNQGGKIHP